MREAIKIRSGKVEQYPPGSVLLLGSSQMSYAIDPAELSNIIGDKQVYSRALAGSLPFRMLAAQKYWNAPGLDRSIIYVSELDLDRGSTTDIFSPSWLRPVISWDGLSDILKVSEISLLFENWKSIFELSIAASTDFWALRDYYRHVLFNLTGLGKQNLKTDADQLASSFGREEIDPRKTSAVLESINLMSMRLNQHETKVIVWDGELNPGMITLNELQWQPVLKEFLDNTARRGEFSLIRKTDAPALDSSYWEDAVHLNQSGRQLLTTYLGSYLNERISK